jgi:hypothetical protein
MKAGGLKKQLIEPGIDTLRTLMPSERMSSMKFSSCKKMTNEVDKRKLSEPFAPQREYTRRAL